VRIWCRDLFKLEVVDLETLTLCSICSCVDSHVAIYYALTGRDLMRRPSRLANRWEDHLLMEYLSARGIFYFNVAAEVSTLDWREPFWNFPHHNLFPKEIGLRHLSHCMLALHKFLGFVAF
jgi:hypothetical protein